MIAKNKALVKEKIHFFKKKIKKYAVITKVLHEKYKKFIKVDGCGVNF